MTRFEPNLLPTGIGSLPHTDIVLAIEDIVKYTPKIPFFPQFTRKNYRENMYVQYSYDLPGASEDMVNCKFHVDTSKDNSILMEKLYDNYINNNIDEFKLDENHAAGFYALLDAKQRFKPVAVKGQITGPVSLGLAVSDEKGKPLLYNDAYMELITKNMAMRGKWIEKKLKEISTKTIISIDEPYLGQLGSAYFNINKEKAAAMIKEILGSLNGTKGIHCCSNTDWAFLLGLEPDIVFFDAYNDGKSLLIYPSEVKKYIENGGIISWGIVPNDINVFKKESVHSLVDKIEKYFQVLVTHGIDMKKLIRQSMLTTTCGLGGCENTTDAEDMLSTVASLSKTLCKRYKVPETDY